MCCYVIKMSLLFVWRAGICILIDHKFLFGDSSCYFTIKDYICLFCVFSVRLLCGLIMLECVIGEYLLMNDLTEI